VGTRAVPGAYAASPSRQAIQRFLKVSERYGYWNATPEENARVCLSVPEEKHEDHDDHEGTKK